MFVCKTVEDICIFTDSFVDIQFAAFLSLYGSIRIQGDICGNTARMILSALSPSELINVISTENANLLKTVKGIGLKTAQRVIVDLKDKIKTSGEAAGTTGITGLASTAANVQVQEEAVAALTMLGFALAPSQKVVMAILKEDAGSSGGFSAGFYFVF